MQSVTGRTFTRLPLTSRYQGKPTSTDCMNGKGAPPCVAHFHSMGLGCLSVQISVLSHTITYAFPIPIYTTSGLSLLIDYTRPHILHAPIWKHIQASPLIHPGLAFLLSNQTLTTKCLSMQHHLHTNVVLQQERSCALCLMNKEHSSTDGHEISLGL